MRLSVCTYTVSLTGGRSPMEWSMGIWSSWWSCQEEGRGHGQEPEQERPGQQLGHPEQSPLGHEHLERRQRGVRGVHGQVATVPGARAAGRVVPVRAPGRVRVLLPGMTTMTTRSPWTTPSGCDPR